MLQLARVTVDPAKRAELEAAYRTYAASLADEPGTLLWELAADADDAGVVWILAKFSDEAAHADHMASPALTSAMAVLQEAMVGPPEVQKLVPLASKSD